MKLLMVQLTAFFLLAMPVASAQSWSGYLVDSKCYEASERNVNPFEATANAVRDKQQEIRQCAASSKTKSFGLVGRDGLKMLKLDTFGNELAVGFTRKYGKKPFLEVTVTGETHLDTIVVNSISTPDK